MSKAQKPKTKSRETSIHSRAARRETSPSIDTDKSLLALKRPDEKQKDSHAIPAIEYAGVTKVKKAKSMSRQQRLRQEKGLEKAEQNLDKLSKKIEDSTAREKVIKSRGTTWDELNDKLAKSRQSEAAAQQVGRASKTAETSNDEIVDSIDDTPMSTDNIDTSLIDASVDAALIDEVL